MKSALIILLFLLVTPKILVAQERDLTPAPSLSVCKISLKTWSSEKIEVLSLDQLFERMHTLVACADGAKKAKKKTKVVSAYLDEFYRTHTELANRTFDFIRRHDLQVEFTNEENSKSRDTAQVSISVEEEKPN
jgi:hypothetical protein